MAKTLWTSAPPELQQAILDLAPEWWLLQIQHHELGTRNWTGKEGQLPYRLARQAVRLEYVQARKDGEGWHATVKMLSRRHEVSVRTVTRWVQGIRTVDGESRS